MQRQIKKNQKRKIEYQFALMFIIMLSIFALTENSKAATLLDLDWDTGSTCSATNLSNGYFSTVSADCTDFGIGTGGPGGRNYLKILLPTTNYSNLIYNASAASFGNPATMYVRFWFRQRFHLGGSFHNISLETSAPSTYQLYLHRGGDSTNTFSLETTYMGVSDKYFEYVPGITLDQWYRLEYKITGAGTSDGTILVRLDGVDITSSMYQGDCGYLSDNNGNLRIPALNYLTVATYYDLAGRGEGMDITGFKITDGPDWIGGDSADTTLPATPSGLSVS